MNNTGFTVATTETLSDLNLATGGKGLTYVESASGGPFTQDDTDLGAGASIRWPRYGDNAAIVNLHSSSSYTTNGSSNGKNVNALSQTITVGAGNVDPADGKVHIRFTFAPDPAEPLPSDG